MLQRICENEAARACAGREGGRQSKYGARYTMAIVYEKLLNLAIPTIEQTYAPKDAMLYALGVERKVVAVSNGRAEFR